MIPVNINMGVALRFEILAPIWTSKGCLLFSKKNVFIIISSRLVFMLSKVISDRLHLYLKVFQLMRLICTSSSLPKDQPTRYPRRTIQNKGKSILVKKLCVTAYLPSLQTRRVTKLKCHRGGRKAAPWSRKDEHHQGWSFQVLCCPL